jgi:hypothetical protein
VQPIGIPASTLYLLIRNQDDIRAVGAAYQRYDFLVADYRPEYHYFDAVEMARKVFMTGKSRGHFVNVTPGT